MATTKQLNAAIAQQRVNLANLNHARDTLKLRKDAIEARHASDIESLEQETKSLVERITRAEKEIAELEAAKAD